MAEHCFLCKGLSSLSSASADLDFLLDPGADHCSPYSMKMAAIERIRNNSNGYAAYYPGPAIQGHPMIRSVILLMILSVSLSSFLACQLFFPTCKFCGASLADGKVHTAEGFDICHKCNQEAVRDLRTAQALLAQVRTEISSMGIWLPWGAIPVKLGLATNAIEYGRCEALRYANGTVASLSIRFNPGLPRSLFKAVAAHELTHAWAYLNRSPNQQDLALSEGGPTYVEFVYLERDRSPAGKYRREQISASTDQIYGGGTRRLQDYARANGGLAGVLTLLKSSQTIPAGY